MLKTRITTPRIYYVVEFQPCGAEHHPAFSEAKWHNDCFRLEFPLHIKGILKSQSMQREWAQEKIKHLKTWYGSKPQMVLLPSPF